jgi:hypothetical protein
MNDFYCPIDGSGVAELGHKFLRDRRPMPFAVMLDLAEKIDLPFCLLTTQRNAAHRLGLVFFGLCAGQHYPRGVDREVFLRTFRFATNYLS